MVADGLNWRLVDHVDTGGVTTGRFWVGKSKTTEEEECVLELDPVRHTLLDALLDLNSGQEQEDLSLEEWARVPGTDCLGPAGVGNFEV